MGVFLSQILATYNLSVMHNRLDELRWFTPQHTQLLGVVAAVAFVLIVISNLQVGRSHFTTTTVSAGTDDPTAFHVIGFMRNDDKFARAIVWPVRIVPPGDSRARWNEPMPVKLTIRGGAISLNGRRLWTSYSPSVLIVNEGSFEEVVVNEPVNSLTDLQATRIWQEKIIPRLEATRVNFRKHNPRPPYTNLPEPPDQASKTGP